MSNGRMKANVQITRPHRSDGEDRVIIRIGCESSNINIVEVAMDPADFLSAIMGRGDMNGEVVQWDYAKAANVGKSRVLKTVLIQKYRVYDKQVEANYIRKHPDIVKNMKDGWEIHDDGLQTRQIGEKHRVIMWKYEPTNAEKPQE